MTNTDRAVSQRDMDALQARIRDLEATLKLNDHKLHIAFMLTPAMNNLLGLLIALPVVTAEVVEQRLEILSDTKVAMHRLREHMRPYGVAIKSRRKLGYWLDPETKEKIKALCSSALAQEGAVATKEVEAA